MLMDHRLEMCSRIEEWFEIKQISHRKIEIIQIDNVQYQFHIRYTYMDVTFNLAHTVSFSPSIEIIFRDITRSLHKQMRRHLESHTETYAFRGFLGTTEWTEVINSIGEECNRWYLRVHKSAIRWDEISRVAISPDIQLKFWVDEKVLCEEIVYIPSEFTGSPNEREYLLTACIKTMKHRVYKEREKMRDDAAHDERQKEALYTIKQEQMKRHEQSKVLLL